MNAVLKLLVFVALVAMIFFVGKSLLKKEEPAAVLARQYTVRRMTIEQAVYGSGVLRCSKRAEISSGVAGKVRELLVQEGDEVKPAQLLCVMSNDQIEDKFATAQKDLDFSQKDYEDKKRSHDEGGPPSARELEQLAWTLEKEKKALKELKEKVDALTVKSPPSLSGNVLRSNLKNSEIRLDPERIYPEGTPLFVIGDLSSLAVDGTILESDRNKVKDGDPAMVQCGNQGWLPAKVANVSLIPSEGGRYDVHLDFETPPSTLNEGLNVQFRVIVERKANVLAVPVEYVEVERGQHWVRRVAGDKAVRVPIKVGISSDSSYEVTSGLKPGDVIRWAPESRE
jgi:multidrug efflux pump subunit AcrA (membrane-fusion protein)